MMRTPSENDRARRGGALLELALFAPLLIYLVVAVGDFGRYYVEESRVSEAAMAEARRVALGGEPGEAAEVESFCSCPTAAGERFACGERSCGGYGEAARYVQASVEQEFSFMGRYPGFPRTVKIHRTAGLRTR